MRTGLLRHTDGKVARTDDPDVDGRLNDRETLVAILASDCSDVTASLALSNSVDLELAPVPDLRLLTISLKAVTTSPSLEFILQSEFIWRLESIKALKITCAHYLPTIKYGKF